MDAGMLGESYAVDTSNETPGPSGDCPGCPVLTGVWSSTQWSGTVEFHGFGGALAGGLHLDVYDSPDDGFDELDHPFVIDYPNHDSPSLLLNVTPDSSGNKLTSCTVYLGPLGFEERYRRQVACTGSPIDLVLDITTDD